MKRDLFDLQTELEGISNLIVALINQNEEGDSLNREYFNSALHSISSHINRIVENLEEMENDSVKEKNKHETN